MNMAIVAGQLQTKYLNLVFAIERGDYDLPGLLLVVATTLGLPLPLAAIFPFGSRLESEAESKP